jgi:archaeal chaperonin
MSLVDAQAELRTKSQTTGNPRFGVDVFKGKIVDLSSRDIYEPLSVKNQVINSGTEAACMILRIDDIISADASKGAPNSPEGGSYGGMPE